MSSPETAAAPVGFDLDKAAAGYDRWLGRQPLAKRTKEAYRAQVGAYLPAVACRSISVSRARSQQIAWR